MEKSGAGDKAKIRQLEADHANSVSQEKLLHLDISNLNAKIVSLQAELVNQLIFSMR